MVHKSDIKGEGARKGRWDGVHGRMDMCGARVRFDGNKEERTRGTRTTMFIMARRSVVRRRSKIAVLSGADSTFQSGIIQNEVSLCNVITKLRIDLQLVHSMASLGPESLRLSCLSKSYFHKNIMLTDTSFILTVEPSCPVPTTPEPVTSTSSQSKVSEPD